METRGEGNVVLFFPRKLHCALFFYHFSGGHLLSSLVLNSVWGKLSLCHYLVFPLNVDLVHAARSAVSQSIQCTRRLRRHSFTWRSRRHIRRNRSTFASERARRVALALMCGTAATGSCSIGGGVANHLRCGVSASSDPRRASTAGDRWR